MGDSSADSYQTLLASQSYVRVVLISVLGALLGVLVGALVFMLPLGFFLAIVLPGAVAGYIVSRFATAWEWPYRLTCGLVVWIGYVLVPMIIARHFDPVSVLLLSPNAIVATLLCKRSLTREQQHDIYRGRMQFDG